MIIFFTTFLLASSVCANSLAGDTQQLPFAATNDKQIFVTMYEPLFAHAHITDEKLKQEAIDKYFVSLKQDYLNSYAQFFSESDINEMIMSAQMELATELQKAYSSMTTIIQDLAVR